MDVSMMGSGDVGTPLPTDVSILGYHGTSICVLHVKSEAGADWIVENVTLPEHFEYPCVGSRVPIERRFVDDIAIGMLLDSLVVEIDNYPIELTDPNSH